tara:strand:- start:960 stop:1769 length:810 start_codon:yes stop_codon:yes gene_type:complete
MNNNSNNIFNVDNYKKNNLSNIKNSNILILFINLINDFILYFIESIEVTNMDYYNYILMRGIESMKHIFNVLFIYTQNLELIMHHLKKSYLYYVEFLNRIGVDKNSFLQLNSKDAIIFVYKKTIFDINTEFKKNMSKTKEENEVILSLLDKVNVYILIISNVINSKYFCENIDNKDKIISLLKQSKKIIIKFIKIEEIHSDLVENYKEFLYLINILDMDIKNILDILYLFLNRYVKSPIDKQQIKNKLFNFNNTENLSNNRFINWLFSK